MTPDNMGSLFFMIFLGAVILTPIFLRNRLLAKQLEALTIAMQQGIDPERVRESLMLRRDEGDVNGNWKAGQVLIWLGVAYLPFGFMGMVAAATKNNGDAGAFMAFLPGVICLVVGGALLRIHGTIIGRVVKRGETLPPPTASAGSGEQSSKQSVAQ